MFRPLIVLWTSLVNITNTMFCLFGYFACRTPISLYQIHPSVFNVTCKYTNHAYFMHYLPKQSVLFSKDGVLWCYHKQPLSSFPGKHMRWCPDNHTRLGGAFYTSLYTALHTTPWPPINAIDNCLMDMNKHAQQIHIHTEKRSGCILPFKH